MFILHFQTFSIPPTLHVSNQQVAVGAVVDPVLESAALLSGLRVAPRLVDLFAVLDRILDEVSDQLLLQRRVGDVVGWTVNQVDGDDPGGSVKQRSVSWRRELCRTLSLQFHRHHSLWDFAEGFNRLSCSSVRLHVLSRCVLDLTLLQSRESTLHLHSNYIALNVMCQKINAHDENYWYILQISTFYNNIYKIINISFYLSLHSYRKILRWWIIYYIIINCGYRRKCFKNFI